MLLTIATLSVLTALILLTFLSVIDLRRGILPNELVLGFFACGLIFHLCTAFAYLTLTEMLIGSFAGGAILYLLRTVANMIYKEDTLGLGDVKLMGAAGLWLGPYFIMIALCAGALIGVFHGLALVVHAWIKSKYMINLSTLSIRAGPAFAAGIVVAGALQLHSFPLLILSSLP